MKVKCFFLFILVTFTQCVGVNAAQRNKVFPEVWRQIQDKGAIAVVVLLNTPSQPEGRLSNEETIRHRQAIASAQSAVLQELSGTTHQLMHRYETSPGLALEVGVEALTVLERSTNVISVDEDRASGPPGLTQ